MEHYNFRWKKWKQSKKSLPFFTFVTADHKSIIVRLLTYTPKSEMTRQKQESNKKIPLEYLIWWKNVSK